MNKNTKILIVGHNDVIENSLNEYFQNQGFVNVFSSSTADIDLLNQRSVQNFFEKNKPQYVFLSSVKSGGIAANQKYPADFIYENLESQNNIIHTSYKSGVKKLLYYFGSCGYPKESPQPIKEEFLLTGVLEETSEPYSVAKIAGLKLCQSYKRQYGFNAIVATPATVYGPGSDVEIETAHVIGALIGKFADAVIAKKNEVVVWGSGKPRREFLYVDDFVNASLFLMDHYNGIENVNVGCGEDVSIKELAEIIKKISGFSGKIVFDSSKSDGTMKKLMDNRSISKLGWKAKVNLKDGIKKTYDWYKTMKKVVV